MSLVSNGSLNENTTPYIGIFSRSGLFPNALSSSAARSSASGCWRKNSHTGGAPGGSGPSDGCLSKSPQQVTERSPRMLSVPIALTWPAFGMPTIMPNCCGTSGSEAVASMRPNSSGGPLYLSRSGRIVDALTVCVGKAQRRGRAHSPDRLRNRRAVLRHKRAGDAVVGAHPGEIVLHHRDDGGLARPDRRMQVVDRRLFETEPLGLIPSCPASRHPCQAVTGYFRRHQTGGDPTAFRIGDFRGTPE